MLYYREISLYFNTNVSFLQSNVPVIDSIWKVDENVNESSAKTIMEKLIEICRNGYLKALVLPGDNGEPYSSVICFHFSTLKNLAEEYFDEGMQLYGLALLHLNPANTDTYEFDKTEFKLLSVIVPESELNLNDLKDILLNRNLAVKRSITAQMDAGVECNEENVFDDVVSYFGLSLKFGSEDEIHDQINNLLRLMTRKMSSHFIFSNFLESYPTNSIISSGKKDIDTYLSILFPYPKHTDITNSTLCQYDLIRTMISLFKLQKNLENFSDFLSKYYENKSVLALFNEEEEAFVICYLLPSLSTSYESKIALSFQITDKNVVLRLIEDHDIELFIRMCNQENVAICAFMETLYLVILNFISIAFLW